MTDDLVISANDHVSFGKLIALWASSPGAIPDQSDQQALREALMAASLHIPERIEKIEIIRGRMDTLHIVVPPAEMYSHGQAHAQELGNAPYDLHQEYLKQAAGSDNRMSATDFYSFRIGEYTCNQCK